MHFAVVLHDIRSTHNVGSMFRTADAVGAEKLYLCGITPDPIDRFGHARQDIAKVALGAESYLPWEHAQSTVRLIGRLKKEGYTICAVEQDPDSMPYTAFKASKTGKVALVMGSEVKGLPRAILSRCDAVLEIPMRGRKESLNVAVAFGIVAFRLFR